MACGAKVEPKAHGVWICAPVAVLFSLAAAGCAGSHQPLRVQPPLPRLAAEPSGPRAAGEAPRPPAEDRLRDDAIRHVVLEGQTLWRIATAYGLEADELARANGIDDPTQLEVGRMLLIPGATAPREVPSYPAPPVAQRRPRHGAGEPGPVLGWPVPGGEILSHFGAPRRGQRRHAGVDIRGPHGHRVLAVAPGRVVYSAATMRGYGKTVILDHGGGLRTLYAHNSALLVREGQNVRKGQAIARVGRTGNASTDHCHFEVRRHGVAVDPLPYLAEVRP